MEVKNKTIKFSDIKTINKVNEKQIKFTLNDKYIIENIHSCQKIWRPFI